MRLVDSLRVLFTSLAVCVAISARADKLHFLIEANGSVVGDNHFEGSLDGAFDSQTTIAIGATKLTSSLSGNFKGGRILDFRSATSNPQGSASFVYTGGKLTVSSKGKSQTVPFVDKDGIYGANVHPALWASALKAAVKSLQSNPAVPKVKLDVKFLDLGATIPTQISQLQNETVSVDGATKVVRRFRVEIGPLACEMDMNDADQVVGFDVPVQHLRFIVEGWEGIYKDPLAKYPELSQAIFKMKTEIGVKMKTRDGVELVCDVVRPDDDQKHPAILVRTPYGRSAETISGAFYASRGYAYVAQDCRGREASSGEWDPFVHEGPDGYDAVQWVAGQPWCDGNVGMIGGSYSGYVQWATAVLHPPALKCIVPQVSPPDAMRNIPYDHGVFALYLDLWWAKIVAGKTTDFSSLQSSLPNPKGLTVLPLSKDDEAVLGKHLGFYQSWLKRPTIEDWKGWDFTYHLDQVDIPALHVSGTWDGDEIGTHINWSTLRTLGRKNQWIVFGPWLHAFNTTHSLGDVEYGTGAIIDLDSLYVRWFDTWLKGKKVGMEAEPHVKLFVTGANKWMTFDDWPSTVMKPETLYFDGLALTPKVGSYRSATFTNDPAKENQIPKQLLSVDPSKATTRVHISDFKRSNSLLLQSQPFKEATAIASPISVHFYFRCSAYDTDFFVAPLDIAPDGSAHVIGNTGKIRASYLQGMDKIRALVPGKVYEAEVVPWDFAHEFKAGHRLGLFIRSSGFPVFSRNLGTAEPIANATKMKVQRNTILMDRRHPSSVSFYRLW